MVWVRKAALSISVIAATGVLACAARADEAFLCGPSTVVYVSPAELETKKHTDPCIAGYFGIKVDKSAAAEAPGAPARKPSQDLKDARASKDGAKNNVALKTLDAPEVERRADAPLRSAALSPPVAAPDTDFRNIRVINASSPDAQWFKHLR